MKLDIVILKKMARIQYRLVVSTRFYAGQRLPKTVFCEYLDNYHFHRKILQDKFVTYKIHFISVSHKFPQSDMSLFPRL